MSGAQKRKASADADHDGEAESAESVARERRASKDADSENELSSDSEEGITASALKVSSSALQKTRWTSEAFFTRSMAAKASAGILAQVKRPENMERARLPVFEKDGSFPNISLKKEAIYGEDLAPTIRRVWRVIIARSATIAFMFDKLERLRFLAGNDVATEATQLLGELEGLTKQLVQLEEVECSEYSFLRAGWFGVVMSGNKKKERGAVKKAVDLLRGISGEGKLLDGGALRQGFASAALLAEQAADIREANIFGQASLTFKKRFFLQGSRGPSAEGPREREWRHKKWQEFGSTKEEPQSREDTRGRGRTVYFKRARGRGMRRGRGSS